MVLICYSLDLQCIPRASVLKMLSGHWGMVETYRGEVSWEEARCWVLQEKSGVYVPPVPLDLWPPWCEHPVSPCSPCREMLHDHKPPRQGAKWIL